MRYMTGSLNLDCLLVMNSWELLFPFTFLNHYSLAHMILTCFKENEVISYLEK